MSPLKARLALAAFLVTVGLTKVSAADEVDRCIAASELGQKEREAGHLADAKSAFLQCASDKCPSVVKSACREWSAQVTNAMPTVIVAITDVDRRDIVDATIEVDARSVPPGRTVALDPGRHTISARAEGYESGSLAILARENERGRTISIVLAKRTQKPVAAPTGGQEERGVRPITWALGGVTVAALTSFAVFGIRGRVLANDLRDTCAPACTDAQRSTAHTSYLVADISLVAALIAGGIGVWTYLTTAQGPPVRETR